jgi:GNAT superfamily N-acetyltransferase
MSSHIAQPGAAAPARAPASNPALPAATASALPIPGRFRSLWWWERPALRAHYGRLSPQDRSLRFHGGMSDEALHRIVEAPMGRDRQVIGWFHEGVLRGVAELCFTDGAAEAAFSVEAPWRRLGVGRALMERALRRAAARGLDEVSVLTNRSNRGMMRLARAYDADFEAEWNEVEGRVPTPRLDPVTMLLDAAEERTGLSDALATAHRDVAARFLDGAARAFAPPADLPQAA